jgi:phosphatidylglycerophosphate synthase
VLLLILGRWQKSHDVTRLSLWLLTLLAVAAIAIKFTGDYAAKQSAPQPTPAKEYVVRHEQAGDQVTTSVFFLGLASTLALFLSRRGRPLRAWILALVLTLGLLTGLLYARTAHSGGQISHPELRSNPQAFPAMQP